MIHFLPDAGLIAGGDKEMSETTCDRCGLVYNPFLGHRFWSGEYTEETDSGWTATYDTLCNACHRVVTGR